MERFGKVGGLDSDFVWYFVDGHYLRLGLARKEKKRLRRSSVRNGVKFGRKLL